MKSTPFNVDATSEKPCLVETYLTLESLTSLEGSTSGTANMAIVKHLRNFSEKQPIGQNDMNLHDKSIQHECQKKYSAVEADQVFINVLRRG